METAVKDLLELSFRPDLGLLFGRWQHQASDRDVQRGYEAMLAEATTHHARYWLLDVRRRGSVSAEATQWVTDQFLPRLSYHFREKLFLAYLVSPSQLSTAPAISTEDADHGHWQASLFANECTALQWLQKMQRQNGG